MPTEYFAACARGIEEALEGELRALGARVERRAAGVRFFGDRRLGYAAALGLRSAVRVQELLLKADVRDARELYEAVAAYDWDAAIRPDQTLAVHATLVRVPTRGRTREPAGAEGGDPPIPHTGYAALTVKDAVVDRLRDRHGRRPDVDRESPDLPLRLVMQGRRALLYRDLAEGSLHRRGWRPVQVKSPLNEATAAGLLLLTGWDRASPLADPMCGSGTFPIEAALLATDRAPGLGRRFAFERWPEFDGAAWEAVVSEARGRARDSLPFAIEGADIHEGAVAIAAKAALDAGVDRLVRFARADCRDWVPGTRPAVVVANPPYGRRLEHAAEAWSALGEFLHRRCAGAAAFVLSGDPGLTRHLGLRASRKWPVRNGPIECRWVRYDVRGE
ncbi:MAG: THUMP domain-containing protein [Planctomycetales bacterium]|nr:THUMP domain-containing protein [Planctomycetales bacterium]